MPSRFMMVGPRGASGGLHAFLFQDGAPGRLLGMPGGAESGHRFTSHITVQIRHPGTRGLSEPRLAEPQEDEAPPQESPEDEEEAARGAFHRHFIQRLRNQFLRMTQG